MCKECTDYFTYAENAYKESLMENQNLICHLTRKGWTLSRDHIIKEGFLFYKLKKNSLEDYKLLINKENIILYDGSNIIEMFERSDKILYESLKIINFRFTIGYYELFKEKQLEKLKEASNTDFHIWKAKIDDDTCPYCRQLHGSYHRGWAPFWIEIKGKFYSLESPPLHWVDKKDGTRYNTCRCERVIVKNEDEAEKLSNKYKEELK